MRDVLVSLVIAALMLTGSAHAAEEKLVTASLLADVDAIAPGKPFTLGLLLKMKEHWHTYWINPGESGEPTQIQFTAPPGLEFGPIQWPIPRKINTNGATTYGYEDEVLLLIPVTVSNSAPLSGKVAINAKATWLSCSGDQCVEGEADLAVTLPVGQQPKPANAPLFAKWQEQLPTDHQGMVAHASVSPGRITLQLQGKARSGVDWYPVSNSAVMLEPQGIQGGKTLVISCKTTIFKPDQLGDGMVQSLLVYTDENGKKRGVWLPIRIDSVKSQ